MPTINDAGMERIIGAVGVKSMAYPVDKDGLRGCLELAFRRYSDAVQLSSDVPDRSEIQRYGKIRKAAKRLEQLIGPVDIKEWALTLDGPPAPEFVSPTRSAHAGFTTTELVAAIDGRLKNWHKPDERYAQSFRKYNPFDWIVGTYLADIYEFIFRTAPTISEHGPFVRFAEAVLCELKIKKPNGTDYKRSSILKTLRTVRAGTVRRRMKAGQHEYVHWSLSQVAKAYRSSSSDFRQSDDDDGQKVKITDFNAVAQYLMTSRDPGFLALLLKLAEKAIADGNIPPGVTVSEVLELVDDPLGELDLGNSE